MACDDDLGFWFRMSGKKVKVHGRIRGPVTA